MNRREFFKAGVAAGGALAFNRLSFGASPIPESTFNFQTRHVIWIMNGNGSRKKEWYESPERFPNFARLVKEGFVYEESHNETVANHCQSWTEMITGNRQRTSAPAYPTPLHYVRKAYEDPSTNYWLMSGVSQYRQWHYPTKYSVAHPDYGEHTQPVSLFASNIYSPDTKRTAAQVIADEFREMGLTAGEKQKLEQFIDATYKTRMWEFNLRHAAVPRDPFVGDALGLALIPHVLKEFKPKMIIYRQVGHDTGHGGGIDFRQQNGYLEYEKVCKTTDEQLGKIIDFVKGDPYFSRNTAIVIRPEFGRDDEINLYGEVNHSVGYNQTCRSAEIWWGPDFKVGVDKGLKNRMDFVPSLTSLFNVDAPFAIGQVHPEMFKDSVGRFPTYTSWTEGEGK